MRLAAGGAKLRWDDVQLIRGTAGYSRDRAEEDAARLGVHPETVWRAYVGRSWKVARYQKLPPEHRLCVVCGERFERRFLGGRHRSDAFWAQKETCGASCRNRQAWAQGVYRDRQRGPQ